jgi:S1-C subfamily serine protease
MSDNILSEFSEDLASAVAKAAQSTVLVNARRRLPASGIAYAADLVLTADHVLEREEEISVILPDGSQVPATIAGRDPARDLALLRLKQSAATPGATPAEAASQPAKVGQLVLALGRPDSNGVQASLGVLSAVGGPVRTGHGALLEQYYRSDTNPYPGFSGGPLVDVHGAVLGINTSALAMGSLITIPAKLAWEAAANLALHGHIRRGYLGIRSQAVELGAAQQKALNRNQTSGLLLVDVEVNSPSASSGLIVGDILVGWDGHPLADHDDLQNQLTGEPAGQPVPVEVLRGGQLTKIMVNVGER